MNAYDFDKTIYDGDSGVNFIKFAFSKRPLLVGFHMVKSLKYIFLYKIHKIEFKNMKEYLFSFVKSIDHLEEMTKEFAQKNKDKIKPYYLSQRKENDLVISASLDFYLLPLCNEMGLKNVICTKYDSKAGKIIGENCKREEKVKRFEEKYGINATIENAYGDSKSDIPMLKRAQKGYVIKNNQLIEYTEQYLF